MKRLTALILFFIFILSGCSVKSAEEYYSSTEKAGELSATLSINCRTAIDYLNDPDRVNPDILTDYTVYFKDGDTVFDALKNACKENKIQFEYDGGEDSVYIKGIDYLYEFDCGDLSGWEYSVNDEFPSVGCNAVELKDGDNIKWLYTCDLGTDIGDSYNGD